MTGLSARQLNRNRTAGRRWELACLTWLRANGWPGAERHADKQASDITGVGDLALEVTTAGWDRLGVKLGQARADGFRRGIIDYAVWRKAHGVADPGMGLVIMHAHAFWRRERRLELLEQAEIRGEDAYRAGFEAGRRERTGT